MEAELTTNSLPIPSPPGIGQSTSAKPLRRGPRFLRRFCLVHAQVPGASNFNPEVEAAEGGERRWDYMYTVCQTTNGGKEEGRIHTGSSAGYCLPAVTLKTHGFCVVVSDKDRWCPKETSMANESRARYCGIMKVRLWKTKIDKDGKESSIDKRTCYAQTKC